jgi:arylsulfatase A-like enzyme
VVLVLTDDQGYGDLGCTGNRVVRTPHIDRLHRESVRFTDFHAESLCAPTRAGLLSGRYPFRTGVTAAIGGWNTLRPQERTLGDVFSAAGYRTGLFGKWHLGDNAPYRAHERGFQQTLSFAAGAISTVADYWGNNYFDDTYSRNGKYEKVRGYCTDVFVQEGLRFIEENRERPFFLYLPLNAPHSPYLVDSRYSEPYEKRGVPPTPAKFYGMIANIDENVGRLRKRLAELGLSDNTIFIFMTDNGTTEGFTAGRSPKWEGYNASMRGKKSSPYEGGHRVPFFLHWPAGGLRTGRDIGSLAAHVDVLPTLAGLCGLMLPAELALDGRSLIPLLKGEAGWPDDRFHVAQHTQFVADGGFQADNPQPFANSAVLTGRWRLVGGKELYDHLADPGQTVDVASANADVVRSLRARYERWWAGIQEGIARPVPIELGLPAEKPTRLTCYEWHTSDWLAWQRDVTAGKEANGYWEVNLPRAGTWRFSLRKFPREAPGPIGAPTARLRIGQREELREADPAAHSCTFEWSLPAGPARMQSWLGEKRGAYFVDAEHVGG